MMKRKISIFIITVSFISCLMSCNSNRSNTKREMDETYVEDGDTINPTEGEGEGTAGQKFMETKDEGEDSLKVNQ